MSLWFQSPMPKKFQAFFFCWTLLVMGMFALAGIQVAMFHYGTATGCFLAAILIVGVGFMIRKRVLRSMGLIKQQQ